METTRNLVNSSRDKKLGNHRVEHFEGGRHFVYHYTPIVTTDDVNKTFTIRDGGWATSSTDRAISSYISQLTYRGYTLELRNPGAITSCESRFYRLAIPENVIEATKRDLVETYSGGVTGEVVKCNKYYIFIKYNGGETLVTNEYGWIFNRLPQYIENFVSQMA